MISILFSGLGRAGGLLSGRICGRAVVLHRIRPFASPFRPYFYGLISHSPNGTLIEGDFRFSRLATVIYWGWQVVAVLLFVAWLAGGNSRSPPFEALAAIGVFWAFGTGLMKAQYYLWRGDCDWIVKRVDSVLCEL
jgi:hypothetical protein